MIMSDRFDQMRNVVYTKNTSARSAVYSDYPEALLPEIKEYLMSKRIDRLYCHQAEMFNVAFEQRQNVVITTSTASGKTLSFLLPVIQDVLLNPATRALFVYPTKALASDQYRAIKPILDFFGDDRIAAGVYDGDTPVNERSRIRSSANIILTNPDMLNSAFLPNHSRAGFSFIFSNLKYVVIDELHTYRGAFGSHLANVFRRLHRICRYYSSSPQFLCSSATIANPVELAENICGKVFQLIEKDGSPAPKKNYYFIQPPMFKDMSGKESVARISAKLVPDLIVGGHSFIVFCKSRIAVEVVLKEARESLRGIEKGLLGYSDLIAGYRGGYKPKERKEIEQKMVHGELRGLISTNALELGIDIGKVDTTVLTGFPGTRASFWQQSGRAGRSGTSSDTYLILDDLSVDQYIAVDPDWLFSNKSENAVIDQNNLFIQLAHVRAAAAELPLTLDDRVIFPNLGEILPVLMNAGEVRLENGKFRWNGNSHPAGDYSIRNMDKERYKLVDKATSETIAEFDEIQAFREIHKGSIYVHNGQSYHVLDLDLEAKTAYAESTDDNYYTVPSIDPRLRIIKEQKSQGYHKTCIHFGDVNVETSIGGHKKVQYHNHQNLGYEQIAPILSKDYDTEGVWFDIPENVMRIYGASLQPGRRREKLDGNGRDLFEGMGFALWQAMQMLTMTTASDVGYDELEDVGENEQPQISICIFDQFTGGMGYAEKAYGLADAIVQNAIKMVRGCRCRTGCPSCVGNYMLDKRIVLWGLENLLEESEPPEGIVVPEKPVIPEIEKEFKIDTISERWKDFQVFIGQTGESMSLFLSQLVSAVRVDEKKLILIVNDAMALLQANDSANKQQIKNTLLTYIEMPSSMSVEFELGNSSESENQQKLARHFRTLRGMQND